MAVTRDDAKKAFALAAELEAQIRALETVPIADLDKGLTATKSAVDAAAIPAARKAALREMMAALGRKLVEAAKVVAAENKKLATEKIMAAAAWAQSVGQSAVVVELTIGTDNKAVGDALVAAGKAHPGVSCLVVSVDEAKGKVLVMAQTMEAGAAAGLSAIEWAKVSLDVVGGKGGGKGNGASGQGTEVAKAGEAAAAARAFAASKGQM